MRIACGLVQSLRCSVCSWPTTVSLAEKQPGSQRRLAAMLLEEFDDSEELGPRLRIHAGVGGAYVGRGDHATVNEEFLAQGQADPGLPALGDQRKVAGIRIRSALQISGAAALDDLDQVLRVRVTGHEAI